MWFTASLRDGDRGQGAHNAWSAPGDGLTALVAHGFEAALLTADETARVVEEAEGVTARVRMDAETERRLAHEAETERLTRPYRERASGAAR